MRLEFVLRSMRVWIVCLCPLLWFCLPLQAKDPAAYQIGDVADADIKTPIALDVVDATATAALRAIKSQQFPSIFRSYPAATNAMAHEFQAAFTTAHSNFLADVWIEFHTATLDEETVASPAFRRLLTVFDVENRSFPITADLAAEWARGQDGGDIREKLLGALARSAGLCIRPDTLPQGMTLAESARLVPVTDPGQKLSFESAEQGPVVSATALTTQSNAQAGFCREFPAENQTFARALAGFIQPNCFPDAAFTQLTRGMALNKLVVSDHFDAGDTIVRRGDAIDAKSKAALAVLGDKLNVIAAAKAAAASSVPQANKTVAAGPAADQTAAKVPPSAPEYHARYWGVVLSLSGISGLSLILAAWQFVRGRKRSAVQALVPVPTAQVALPFPDTVKAELAPQVALAVREAVQQELAMQRRELLMAQQAATDEIAALVSRLDELQVPMQARLHTYETRIKMLEAEIAVRNEENRALLKLKIEMTSRQLETERAATLIPPLPL